MDDSEVHFLTNFSPIELESTFNNKIKNKTGKGIDGVSSVQIENNLALITSKISSKVLNSKYRFSPYLEIVKSKGRGKKPRIISKPTIRDKLTLCALKDTLHAQYEHCIQKQLPNTFIREIKQLLNEHNNEEIYYLKIDIKGFYDNLNHKILLNEHLSEIKNEHALTLIRRAIKNKTVPKNYKKENSSSYHNKVGVPQGLSISNVLAGIYMNEFDKSHSAIGLKYFRYVDDILVFAKKDEITSIEKTIDDSLNLIGLETNDKTEKGIISKSFDYLGYQISSEKISVRDSTIDRFINSLIAMFTDFKLNFNYRLANSKWLTAEHMKELFILNVNEKVTGAVTETKRYGWIFYFIEITDIHLLHKLDSIINKQFSRMEMFNNVAPKNLKNLVKSHYSAKFSTFDGYIHNYGIYDTVIKKIQFLVKFGYINEQDTKNYTEEEIERKFEIAKSTRLVKLEEDIGNIS
jgi:retron-type reverse transcriptase